MKTSKLSVTVAALLSALVLGNITTWEVNAASVGKKGTLIQPSQKAAGKAILNKGTKPSAKSRISKSKASIKRGPALVHFGSGAISNVSGGTVTARNRFGTAIEFSLPQSKARYLNRGQKVWTSGNNVMGVEFPIRMETKNERLHHKRSHWMKTRIKISSTGRIDGETRTWSSECARGFTGGVVVYLMDEYGNNLYNTPMHKYGVNGECLGDPHDRKEVWSDPVPQDVLNKVRNVAITHLRKPTDRWDDFLEKAKKVAEIAKVFVEIYAKTQS